MDRVKHKSGLFTYVPISILQSWSYIQRYEKALRVDEDVVLITGPILEEV